MPRSFDGLFHHALELMDKAFTALQAAVPAPARVPHLASYVYRYKEQSAEQAIVQKLARIVTGLRAALLLHQAGLMQELGVIQRTMDEISTDVQFLAYGLITGEPSEHQQKFLDAFYAEPTNEQWLTQTKFPRPNQVIRSKVEAYVRKASGLEHSEREVNAANNIFVTYSGFVHGASHVIMDMVGGHPPRFHLTGMLGTPREISHRDDLWNYFYRGLASFAVAASAFQMRDLFDYLYRETCSFEDAHPRSFPR